MLLLCLGMMACSSGPARSHQPPARPSPTPLASPTASPVIPASPTSTPSATPPQSSVVENLDLSGAVNLAVSEAMVAHCGDSHPAGAPRSFVLDLLFPAAHPVWHLLIEFVGYPGPGSYLLQREVPRPPTMTPTVQAYLGPPGLGGTRFISENPIGTFTVQADERSGSIDWPLIASPPASGQVTVKGSWSCAT